jgi:hypothetical protein
LKNVHWRDNGPYVGVGGMREDKQKKVGGKMEKLWNDREE